MRSSPLLLASRDNKMSFLASTGTTRDTKLNPCRWRRKLLFKEEEKKKKEEEEEEEEEKKNKKKKKEKQKSKKKKEKKRGVRAEGRKDCKHGKNIRNATTKARARERERERERESIAGRRVGRTRTPRASFLPRFVQMLLCVFFFFPLFVSTCFVRVASFFFFFFIPRFLCFYAHIC